MDVTKQAATVSELSLNVLIVEDDSLIALSVSSYIKHLGHKVMATCDTGLEACNLAAQRPDIILMDIRLKGPMSGLEAARIIQKDHPTRIIFVTANPDLLKPFIQDNWFHNCMILAKPIDKSQLDTAIQSIMKVTHLQAGT